MDFWVRIYFLSSLLFYITTSLTLSSILEILKKSQ